MRNRSWLALLFVLIICLLAFVGFYTKSTPSLGGFYSMRVQDVSFTPTSSATFNPGSTNLYDIGAPSYLWKDLYLGGTAYVSTSLRTANNNLADIGAYGTAFKNLYVSSTAFVTNVRASSTWVGAGTTGSPTIASTAYPTTGLYWSPGGVLATVGGTSIAGFLSTGLSPAAHNTFDLGTYAGGVGALAFKDVFASGTARLGKSVVSQAAATSTIAAVTGVTGKGGQVILKDAINANCYAFASINGTLSVTGLLTTCP